MSLHVPPSSVGFKEWSFVCDSLTQGIQTIILRKGGIHEGRGGFEWKHQDFFLFPTWFHTQAEKLRRIPENAVASFPPEEERTHVDITGYSTLEHVWKVTDWKKMEAIEPLHLLNEDVVRERFAYDEECCLHIALVRAYVLPERWTFPYTKSYGGCRSWVNLPEDGLRLLGNATPALKDEVWNETAQKLRAILD